MKMRNTLFLLFLVPALTAGTALDQASAAQQTAITELVQSLKSARKVILTGNRSASGNKSGQNRNVFRDRQKFILPEMPREQNPAEQLRTQIREQQQLLDQMRNTSPADAAAQEQMTIKQKNIQENVRKTAETPSLPRGTAQALNQARNAMKEAGKMLKSVRLSDYAPADGFESEPTEAEDSVDDLDAFLDD